MPLFQRRNQMLSTPHKTAVLQPPPGRGTLTENLMVIAMASLTAFAMGD